MNRNLEMQNGATTLSIMTFSITTLSIIGLFATISIIETQQRHSAKQLLSSIMLSVFMLSVVMLNVVMMSVVVPYKQPLSSNRIS